MRHILLCLAGLSIAACTPREENDSGGFGTPTPCEARTAPATNAGSMSFDGVDDRLIVAAAISLSDFDAFTIEAWVMPLSSGALATVVAKAPQDYLLGRTATNTINSAVQTGVVGLEVESTLAVPTGAWTHIAMTWTNPNPDSFMRTYVNGAPDLEVNESSLAYSEGPTLLSIGWLAGEEFTGFVDDVRIWNVLRTQAEIAATMSSSFTAIPPSLVGYWPMESVTDGETLDYSGLCNDAQLGSEPGADGADPTPNAAHP